MAVSQIFLNRECYTWKNALLWGNCIEHGKKALSEGRLGYRVVQWIITGVEALPLIGQIMSIFEKLIVNALAAVIYTQPITNTPVNTPPTTSPINNTPPPIVNPILDGVINNTPAFAGYKISLPPNHPAEGVVLTGVNRRPNNLFFDALFEGTPITATMPGSNELFRFKTAPEEVRRYCKEKAQQTPDGIVAFTANGKAGHVITRDMISLKTPIGDLSEIYGSNTYRMSYREIEQILDSQKIFISESLPVAFYRGLKAAMKADGIVILPGNDSTPCLLREMRNRNQVGHFLASVEANPRAFGFSHADDFDGLLDMTLYQIGSMVVKTEDYYILVDGNGKILERNAGKRDAVRLINACGIRGFHSPKTPSQYNKPIMTQTFKTALHAAHDGFVVFPAVGMGVWRGDPDLYWRAFFDAILASDLSNIDAIFVNPGHQQTISGPYQGHNGTEFQLILNEYLAHFRDNAVAMGKLSKIRNLFDSKKDLVQLAYNLKVAFPDKTVSLFNASDPDVTLGYHVGEYVNHIPHTITTEENYTAMGTNGLCFEDITGVHNDPGRIIQAH